MFEYRATAINVVDGDTLDVAVDLGLNVTIVERVRLYGVNTPERGELGYSDATAALTDLVAGRPLICRTVKPHEKYGRWLALIETPECDDVAQSLIDAGLGVPYFGGAR